MKNKLGLILFVLLSSFFFYSCDDDNKISEDYLTLSDIGFKQEANGKSEVCTLSSTDDVINYSTTLIFANKPVEMKSLTFEQQFDPLLVVNEDEILVKDFEGKELNSVNVSLASNTVEVKFLEVNKDYSYVSGNTFTVTIPTNLKSDISKEELERIASEGIKAEAKFYGDNASSSITSNSVVVNLESEEPGAPVYNVKGDPRNNDYKYKLNVVYFVPSDITPNDAYQERISTILLKHQLFVCKWMKHWGYEEKSFGLQLADNGMIDIVTVNGNLKKADYPYSGGNSKMKKEIEAYYKENGLEFLSEHTLVITATNGDISETPFYGSGKWCYALDYPGMSYDLYNIDPLTHEAMNPTPLTTALIGGLLHELGHGLNEPHVGPTYTQKNDPLLGMTLMGSGNSTYGKKPTFLHHSSAAIMNNCQVSSFVEKTFYNSTTSSITIDKPVINGSQCTVKGSFTASSKVTEVVVRFFNSTEAFQGGSSGYTSVAFVTKPTGNNFEITIPIEELRVQTFKYKVGVMILMENGTSNKLALNDVYRLVKDGSEYTLENESISNDGTWEVTVSHKLPKDDAIKNSPNSLVDGNLSTSLSMVKPGKSYDGITVPATDVVYAIIDFKKQIEFNAIDFTNRNFQKYLNPKAVSVEGSNDGVNYSAIKLDFALPENVLNTLTLGSPVKYQYLKITYVDWDKTQGSTMQFAELGLKYVK